MSTRDLSTASTTIRTDDADMFMERLFDAPRELVWKAFTEPQHVVNWWGPRGTTTTVVEMDVRPGGTWRFINHGADGGDAPFKGEYLEIVAPERLVQTFVYDVEGFADQAVVETLTFEDLGGKTRLTQRSRFPSVDALEGALASGMTGGAVETLDRLDEVLAALKGQS